MYGTYAAPTSKPKRCCKRLSVSPKVLQKARPAHCEMPFAAWVFHVQYHQIKGAAKKKQWSGATSLHTYILIHYILTQVLQEYQCITKGAAKEPVALHIYIYIHIDVLALHPYRCCNVSPKVLQKVPTSVNSTGAAKVPVHHMSTIAAPPHRTPGFPKERKERMKHLLLQCPGAFFGMSWILVRRPSHDLHVFSI